MARSLGITLKKNQMNGGWLPSSNYWTEREHWKVSELADSSVWKLSYPRYLEVLWSSVFSEMFLVHKFLYFKARLDDSFYDVIGGGCSRIDVSPASLSQSA